MTLQEAEQAVHALFASRSSNAIDEAAGMQFGGGVDRWFAAPQNPRYIYTPAGILKSLEGRGTGLSPLTQKELQVLVLERKIQARPLTQVAEDFHTLARTFGMHFAD